MNIEKSTIPEPTQSNFDELAKITVGKDIEIEQIVKDRIID